MRVRLTAMTHRGLVRDHNEDSLGWAGWALSGENTASITQELDVVAPVVAVVCDGMGGHASGETASRMSASLLTAPGRLTATTEEAVTALIQQTSEAINNAADRQPILAGMGCTVVGVVIRPDGTALVFNVGDSRCYRVEGQYLAQLSVDHRSDPDSSALTQALGGGRRMMLAPDFFECEIPPDPGLILCTDGLDDYAQLTDIEARVLKSGDGLVNGLRDLALAGGGGDNVSVLQVTLSVPIAGTDMTVPGALGGDPGLEDEMYHRSRSGPAPADGDSHAEIRDGQANGTEEVTESRSS